jgi:predicted Zn-dependent protease
MNSPRNPLAVVLSVAAVAFAAGKGTSMWRSHAQAVRARAAQVGASAPTVAPQGASTDTVRAEETLTASGPVAVRVSATPPPARDDQAVADLIAEGAHGTYLGSILEQQNRLLMRWPSRNVDALRVWIERISTLPDYNDAYPVVAERAFDEWSDAGFPLRFDIVRDSSTADIHIRWVPQLEAGTSRIGVTRKTRDQYGWLIAADIDIALHDTDGKPLSPAMVAGVARHEIGHALGLGHSADTSDVMYPESVTPRISAADRATMHLLYMLPPGVVK